MRNLSEMSYNPFLTEGEHYKELPPVDTGTEEIRYSRVEGQKIIEDNMEKLEGLSAIERILAIREQLFLDAKNVYGELPSKVRDGTAYTLDNDKNEVFFPQD
ncbi:MAG: hypothetical protein KC414_14350, partial [Romboutsia sp.]|nr:hypothetical protein [Romboutsia sp.]